MKFVAKIFLLLFCVTSLFSNQMMSNDSSNTTEFSKEATGEPVYSQTGEKKESCPICGMSLKKFYKTTHMAKLEDGTNRHYCSIRCLVADTHDMKVDMNTIKAIDAKTEDVINANEAFYVVGSNVHGTMSRISKLAFKNKDDALEFIKQRGGELKTFEEAFKIADLEYTKAQEEYKDKKEKETYPMGEKIYKAKCNEIDATKYISKPLLYEKVQNECKNLNKEQLNAVIIYLWDIKRHENKADVSKNQNIEVTKKDRCPVCGMFVYKFPTWATKVFYDGDKYFVFDGVKDMMKFLQNPKEYEQNDDFKAEKILVTDYYSQKAIDAKKAFYVFGSDVLGPMGNELIPFEDESQAKTFLVDHKGKSIIKFADISTKIVCELDGQKCE